MPGEGSGPSGWGSFVVHVRGGEVGPLRLVGYRDAGVEVVGSLSV